jgi:hypothetical protein
MQVVKVDLRGAARLQRLAVAVQGPVRKRRTPADMRILLTLLVRSGCPANEGWLDLE